MQVGDVGAFLLFFFRLPFTPFFFVATQREIEPYLSLSSESAFYLRTLSWLIPLSSISFGST